MYTTYYYTLLQQLLLHCYLYRFILNCWLILTSCCKTRRKMLVFDRPSIFPLILVFSILQSTIQPPLSIRYMHKSLVAGRKTRGYTRYSPALFPLLFCPIGRCSRRWSPGAGDPRHRPPQREGSRCRLRRRVPPLSRSSLEVPRQEASPFRSCCVCASLLKATLYSRVCT